MPKASPKTSEKLTRTERIDRRLTDTGWRIVLAKDFNLTRALTAYNGCAIEEYPTANGPADYALCVNGQILGIVEAKKLTLGPQNVLSHAERYSRGVTASPMDFRRRTGPDRGGSRPQRRSHLRTCLRPPGPHQIRTRKIHRLTQRSQTPQSLWGKEVTMPSILSRAFSGEL